MINCNVNNIEVKTAQGRGFPPKFMLVDLVKKYPVKELGKYIKIIRIFVL